MIDSLLIRVNHSRKSWHFTTCFCPFSFPFVSEIPSDLICIDAFAGSGQHISRSSGELVAGSPQNALEIFINFSMMDMKRNVLLRNIENRVKIQHDRID